MKSGSPRSSVECLWGINQTEWDMECEDPRWWDGVEGPWSYMGHLGGWTRGIPGPTQGVWGYELGGSCPWCSREHLGDGGKVLDPAGASGGRSIPVQEPLSRLQPLSSQCPSHQGGTHEASQWSCSHCQHGGFLRAPWPCAGAGQGHTSAPSCPVALATC